MEQNADTGVQMTPVVDDKKNNGNGLKIATAIACIVAFCGIGFGVYGMMQGLNKDSRISDLENQIKELSAVKPDSNEEEEGSEPNLVGVSSFESFSNNLINKIKALDDTVQFYKQETKILDWSEKQFRAKIDKDANLVLTWNNYNNEEVLAENVIDFEFVVFGNGGGDTYLYFINQDGSVSKTEDLQNVEENAPAITNNIGNYKEVISIQTTHGNYPYGSDGFYASFTDFNGNILSE